MLTKNDAKINAGILKTVYPRLDYSIITPKE